MSTETAPAPAVASPAANQERKPIHTLVLDTGPLIKNDPPVSTLLAQADELFMLPSIIDEIRDVNTRTRVQTTLMPFVKLRNPRPDSIKFVTNFARRTGDLEVLSRPDLHLLALTYELDVEKNGGDSRLRKDPNQRVPNTSRSATSDAAEGKPTQEVPSVEGKTVEGETVEGETVEGETVEGETVEGETVEGETVEGETSTEVKEDADSTETEATASDEATQAPRANATDITQEMENLEVQEDKPTEKESAVEENTAEAVVAKEDVSDDEDGWITPSNVKKHKEKDSKRLQPTEPAVDVKVGILTSDYAMQNVALRIGLNLLSPAMSRITQLKTWVLRCHGCFQVCKKMDKQFCPSCGQATLTRTSCTTEEDGSFKIHLKRNFQWNNRGNVFSIPKPVAGTSSGKLAKHAGGKNNWGTNLIFAEDQREYEKAVGENRRARRRDLMDEDYLPSILTGDRTSNNGKVRLGPGRNVNGRKKR
ncbi:20S-pre-rRNA D-site endonuclease NOB1 [Colletotrichum gloeosporioides]|uniref:20S-pre-rRNA D-site endonuclease NOB1 n=1 Tax=Colletotrichum gloeosporioides TaxID=474922 RepID=A0A8H4FFK2_COLGL|nr:20S-pre-rRNA D-site endonuclease NOB1 [Colletotrichum gloeosporioides]KAF3799189.1 20S-pre-rRNA D-site endonuclease NOB1 [Colletotrichum gloeosporioides]